MVEFGNPMVCIAVTGGFVSTCGNAPNHLRVAFRDPSQGEESSARAGLNKRFKNQIDVALDPARRAVPKTAIEMRRQRRHLEIVLYIDGQCVRDLRAGCVN